MTKNEKPHIAFVLFCLGMSIAAACFEIYSVSMFLRLQAAQSWPKADAVITRSEVVWPHTNTQGPTARISYRYSVGGKEFSSDSVRPRGTTFERKKAADADALVASYPVGSTVAAYYNPAQPNDALLVVVPDFVDYVLIISPLFSFLRFWSMLLTHIKGSPSQQGGTSGSLSVTIHGQKSGTNSVSRRNSIPGLWTVTPEPRKGCATRRKNPESSRK